MSVTDGIVKTWVKVIFKTATWRKKGYINSYMLSLMEFDLSGKKIKILARATFQSNGSVIFSKEYPYAEREVIYPESVLDGIFKKVKSSYAEKQ